MDLPLSHNGLTLTDELVRYQLGNKFKNNAQVLWDSCKDKSILHFRKISEDF